MWQYLWVIWCRSWRNTLDYWVRGQIYREVQRTKENYSRVQCRHTRRSVKYQRPCEEKKGIGEKSETQRFQEYGWVYSYLHCSLSERSVTRWWNKSLGAVKMRGKEDGYSAMLLSGVWASLERVICIRGSEGRRPIRSKGICERFRE